MDGQQRVPQPGYPAPPMTATPLGAVRPGGMYPAPPPMGGMGGMAPPPVTGIPAGVPHPPLTSTVSPAMSGGGSYPPPQPPMAMGSRPPMSGTLPMGGGMGMPPPPTTSSMMYQQPTSGPMMMGGTTHMPPPPPAMAGRGPVPPPPMSSSSASTTSVPPPMHPPLPGTSTGMMHPPPTGMGPGSYPHPPSQHVPGMHPTGTMPPPPISGGGGGMAPPPMSRPPGFVPSTTGAMPPPHHHLGGGMPPPTGSHPMGGPSSPPPVPTPSHPTGGTSHMFAGTGAPAPAPGIIGTVSQPPVLKDSELPRPDDAMYDDIVLDRTPKEGEESPAIIHCPKKFCQMSFECLPASAATAVKLGVPVGGVIQPLAMGDVPCVNFGSSGVIRCRRCRTYINPYINFLDGGRRWQCNVCRLVNDLPADYFCPLDVSGKRTDLEHHPELTHGCVEFVASEQYMVRPPQPPVYVFVVEVTSSTLTSGFTQDAFSAIRDMIDHLPGKGRTQVAFVTFSSSVHLYTLKSGDDGRAQQIVMPDVADPFVPVPDDLLVNLSECETAVHELMEHIPSVSVSSSSESERVAFGAAVKVAVNIMESIGGKMCVFASSLPANGVGKLRGREDVRIYGTDRESTLFQPAKEGEFYRDLAIECAKRQVSIDLFLGPHAYMDVASVSQLSRFTGGTVRMYSSYRSQTHRNTLSADVRRTLSSSIAFESVMRIRCSMGLKAGDFTGNFFLRSNDLMAVPNIQEDHAIGFHFIYTGSSIPTTQVVVQAALLYTSSRGERRIRVQTMLLPVSSNIRDIYASADATCCAALIARQAAVDALLGKASLASIRNTRIQDLVLSLLRTYRTTGGAPQPGSQLILPGKLTILPLLTLGLLKHAAFRLDTDVRADERITALCTLSVMGIHDMLPYVLPRLFLLHPTDGSLPPKNVPLSRSHLDKDFVYVLDDGQKMIVYASLGSPGEPPAIPEHVQKFIREHSSKYPAHHRPVWLCHVNEGGALERAFHSALVEDRMASAQGYAEYLTSLHQSSLR
eukprot:TRINITY_DN637_c0_g2_i2.p1 TRINITY_DN637_c0_g2~~TRINITY_DN637_c0_g2_i2.p1  ORF type:complete len:1023 (-),score=238.34 TRINITY_DN637_c0_g2_i2:882-3950(-)